MSYAIISLGGKQYRVREGEWLLVDRVPTEAGKTFNPAILMLGGDGNADFEVTGVTVTARVVEHVLGEKIRIGKYRPKNGYKRHTGFRSSLSKIEIESIGKRAAAAKTKPEPVVTEAQPEPVIAEEKPKAVVTPKPAAKPKAAPKPKAPAAAAAKPKAPAKPKPAAAAKPKAAPVAKKPPARKPAPKKETDT